MVENLVDLKLITELIRCMLLCSIITPNFLILGWPEMVQLVIKAMSLLGSWEPEDMRLQSI